MTMTEFFVALVRDMNTPAAVAIVGTAVAIAARKLTATSVQSREIEAEKSVQLKKLETSVRNGSVAMTRSPE